LQSKKSQNLYIKASLKVQNTYNKVGFKMAYIGENPRICSNKKKPKISQYFLAAFAPLQKNIVEAQIAKFRRIWSHFRKLK
jgi:hypothetical protein